MSLPICVPNVPAATLALTSGEVVKIDTGAVVVVTATTDNPLGIVWKDCAAGETPLVLQPGQMVTIEADFSGFSDGEVLGGTTAGALTDLTAVDITGIDTDTPEWSVCRVVSKLTAGSAIVWTDIQPIRGTNTP